ncbi:MAG: transglutaminase-like domain-containing protein, partial [Oscillospiraceae bacterium]|nr:transglutaminase-like domain-containing protein [Oscillospiraceae bacterium]
MKKLLSSVLTLVLAVAMLISVTSVTVAATPRDTFATTRDPSRYAVFTANGDTIEVQGRYAGAQSRLVSFAVVNISGNVVVQNSVRNTLAVNADGSFTASFQGAASDGAYRMRLTFNNNDTFDYRVYRNGNGWNFGTTELEDKHTLNTENYMTTPLAVTAQYLVGPNGSRQDAVATLAEIQRLSGEITAGMNSDYEKARAVARWVSANIHYDRDSRDIASTPELIGDVIALSNVLDTRKTICSGYANLTAALLNSLGFKAITIMGSAVSVNEPAALRTENRLHEWTAFWYEGESRWVHLDAGWDSWNYFERGNYTKLRAPERY